MINGLTSEDRDAMYTDHLSNHKKLGFLELVKKSLGPIYYEIKRLDSGPAIMIEVSMNPERDV